MEWIADDSVFITTDDRNLYLATNNVQMYEKISVPVIGIEHLEIDNNVLYLSDFSGELLLASRNFGMTWDSLRLPLKERIEAFLVIGQVIIIIQDYDRIWQSSDRGETWTEVFQTKYPWNSFHDVGERVVITNRYQWYLSLTQGVTWEEFNPQGLPAEAPEVNEMLLIDDVLFAVIPAHGVYVSYDFGDHWQSFNEGLETLRGRSLAYSDGILALGTSQGSIWLRDISATLDIPSEKVTQDLLIYPVPGDVVFNFILPESVHGIATLELCDLKGQKVYSAGLNSIYGSLPELYLDLLPGLYLASLTCENQKYIGKIVIAR
jgi:hypothetical protein